MKVDELIDDVLLLMGENPKECLWEGEAEGGCTLRERIRQELEEAAAEAVVSTPRMQLTGWRLLPDEGLRIDDDGRGVLPLPDDFLLLYDVRMTSWERRATEVHSHDDWKRRLQDDGRPGLRGTPRRPLVFFCLNEEGKLSLELFSCRRTDVVAEGWYMPAPRISAAGEIEIPPAAYQKCINALATLS